MTGGATSAPGVTPGGAAAAAGAAFLASCLLSGTAAATGPTGPAAMEGSGPSPATPSVCTAWATNALAPPRTTVEALSDPGPPEYYAFPLVTTGRITGTARSGGHGRVVFPATSPFGVALAEDGSYRYDLLLDTEGLPEPDAGEYVVWITTPSVDRIRRVGALPESGRVRGRVSWNKFLVVVTLEPSRPSSAVADDGWSGPIVLRGMSRSGMMHTMAGHGPFEQENCASFGY